MRRRPPPTPGHLAASHTANSLLWGVLARLARQARVGNERCPVVEAFGLEYWLVGSLDDGALYRMPYRPMFRPELLIRGGLLYEAGGRPQSVGYAVEVVSFVLAAPPPARTRRVRDGAPVPEL